MDLTELLEDRDRLINRKTVPILMSSEHADECYRAQNAVEKARAVVERAEAIEKERLDKPRTTKAREDLAQAEAELEAASEAAAEHVVDFVVESVGSDLWEEIVDAHPPTKEQKDQYGDGMWFNPRTFPEVAIGCCLAEPQVPSDDIKQYLESMRDGFPEGQPDSIPAVRKLRGTVNDIVWQQLLAAVIRVNRGANAIPKSLTGSGSTRSSASG